MQTSIAPLAGFEECTAYLNALERSVLVTQHYAGGDQRNSSSFMQTDIHVAPIGWGLKKL